MMEAFVPTAVLRVPEKVDEGQVPRTHLLSYMGHGDHSAASEEPKLLAQDIRKSVSLAGSQ